MSDKKVRTRFAPSPTGYLHIGGLRTALYAYLFAKKNGGDFILRLEDTDRERLVGDAAEIIYSTLKETGLNYDEGPDVGGDFGPYIQSERKDLYKKYAEELVDAGAAYYCFCSKERLSELKEQCEREGKNPKYDKHCLGLPKEEIQRRIDEGEPYVIRQNVPTDGETTYKDAVFGEITVPNADLEDNILLKSDGYPTYNLANVVDDHLMGITHVIRGVEYLASTPKYNMLYDALNWERPEYIHLSPVMKDKQHKLSKRNGDASFEDLVLKGYLPEAILNYIALLGWSPGGEQEIFDLDELIKAFDLDGISKSPAIFDEAKLRWMNAEYIKNMSDAEFIERAKPYINEVIDPDKFDLSILAEILKPRIEALTEIPGKIEFLSEMPDYDASLYIHKKMKVDEEKALSALKAALPVLEETAEEDFNKEGLHDKLMDLAKQLEIKNGQLLYPLRIAVTGTAVTPGGAIEAAALLGKEKTLSRLKKSIALLEEAV